MSHHPDGHNGSRVRHVPIHIERRDGCDAGRQNGNHFQQYQQQPDQSHRHQASPHQPDQSHRFSTPTRNMGPGYTEMTYESPSQRHRQRNQPSPDLKPQPQSNHNNDDQPYPMEDVIQSDFQENHNKENSDRASQLSSQGKQSDSNGLPPDDVIPLPPPPEKTRAQKSEKPNVKQEGDQQQLLQEQQQQQQDEIEAKKPKKINGPVEVLEATRDEVMALLKEIAVCNETSQESKECRRLDEFLTRCILKLDNIDCSSMPELRQQRKAIITMIDKCTDILKRKVSLNFDIQQLLVKIP